MSSNYHRPSLINFYDTNSTSDFEEDDITVPGKRDEFREAKKLISNETAAVHYWREVVTGMLIIASCMITVATFIVLSREQKFAFVRSLDGYVTSMGDSAEVYSNTLQISMSNLGDLMTFEANQQKKKKSWPFVTLPSFEVVAHHAREETGTEFVGYSPLTTKKDLSSWGQFVDQRYGRQIDAVTDLSSVKNTLRYIHGLDPNNNQTRGPGPYAPILQMSPQLVNSSLLHFDVLLSPELNRLYHAMLETRQTVFSQVLDTRPLIQGDLGPTIPDEEELAKPRAIMFQPIYSDFSNSSDIAAFLEVAVPFKQFLDRIIPEANDLFIVLNNTCGDLFTFYTTDQGAEYLGKGDLHDEWFDHYETILPILGNNNETISNVSGHCSYSLHIYPSLEIQGHLRDKTPGYFTLIVGLVFFFIAFSFFIYDKFVQKRNNAVLHSAAQSNAIVSSMFPTTIRDRIVEVHKEDYSVSATKSNTFRLKSFLREGDGGQGRGDVSKPIADLFPDVSILFTDIVGFTAWSSAREPTQVFTLLESVFKGYDEIAKRRRVFKVETVGDCYVAVTGLPDPRKDHAIVMARFAMDCLYKMRNTLKELECTLGPDTGDLSMRFGIHSGPVTAGVLRGDRARFQLFGDTMNTASRMETTGKPGYIHISQQTAQLLIGAGKSHWITPRDDKVHAKGKGEMQTFWLSRIEQSDGSSSMSNTSNELYLGQSRVTGLEKLSSSKNSKELLNIRRKQEIREKIDRLIEWNVENLQRHLKAILARRRALGTVPATQDPASKIKFDQKGRTVLDDVQEIIKLPKFHSKAAKTQEDPDSVDLGPAVRRQLHDFVSSIAAMYKDNHFHNFLHASHVTMSVVKLLSRIVAPKDLGDQEDSSTENTSKKMFLSKMHDHTYGITSDPLTQFSVILAALIHDVDHEGVPNAALVKENFTIAKIYKNKSVAEQNSVDLAWRLLMSDRYKDLRAVIYCNEDEFTRFRQLVVNTVMATDIVDKELKDLRNARWDKAFNENGQADESKTMATNRKATIVIEHLIQASDVSHTMQHWIVYRKWNEKFFREMYKAYRNGRADKDPSESWYQGEIGFFNFYIIPLAKKLKDCGVFGVSSDEYLNYAIQNRDEWAIKGQAVVAEMLENVKKEMEANDHSSSQSSKENNAVRKSILPRMA